MTETNAPDRRWLTLLAMTGSLSMIMLDSTVLGVALPSIRQELNFDDSTLAWAVNGYLLAMASWVAIGGRLGDWMGRINAFRLGMVGFMIASIGCALAPTALVFIAARIIQGICAGTMQPASSAIVIDIYPAKQRGRAMATYAGISLLFMAGGPLIGGALVQFASWHWCFWLNVPIALISLGLTLTLKMKSIRAATRKTDWPSILILLAGTPLLVSGLQELGLHGLMTKPAWVSIVIGGGLLSLFAHRQLRLTQPTIDLRLFRDRGLFGNAFLLLCVSFINVGQGIYGSFYMQTFLGFTPMQAGLGTLPLLVPVLIVIHFAGRMYDHHGPRRPIMLGLCFVLIGTVIETIGVFALSYPILAIGMAVLGLGCGFAMSPANADSLSRAPIAQRGEASGLVQMMRQFGSTIGIALMVLVMHGLTSPIAQENAASTLTARDIGFGFGLHVIVALTAFVVGYFCIQRVADPQVPGSAVPPAANSG